MHSKTSAWLVPVAMLAAASTWLGCGKQESQARVSDMFPAQAAQVLGGDGFFQSPSGFAPRLPPQADPVKAAEASLSSRRGLRLHLPAEGDSPATFSLPGGFSIEVRERGLSGVARSVEGAVIYPRTQGESYWDARSEGYEEWVLVEDAQDGAVAEWKVGGASLRQLDEAVEIVDAKGLTRLRVTAPFAIDAHGKKARAWLALRGEVIELHTDARGPALVDPFWASTGSMATERVNHTATRLLSGKVLVAGGYGYAGYLASAELYDPRTGTWSATGSLTTAREKHTATLLPSGDVLVVGGDSFGAVCLDSAELYSWRMGTWTRLRSGGGERCEHTATLLPSGQVLVAGGYSSAGILPSAIVFLDAERGWQETRWMHTERRGHTATLLATGEVLVVGGLSNTDCLNSAELYDPLYGWHGASPLAVRRYGHSATLLPSGQVLVVGGVQGMGDHASAELFDPATRRWAATGSLATERYLHSATLLSSGKVLVAGGWNPFSIDQQYFAGAEIYDPATGNWTAGASLATARTEHTATLLSSGNVLIAGGFSGYFYLASAELYYASTGSWTPTRSMGVARAAHTATLLPSGQVLVAGGCNIPCPPGGCTPMFQCTASAELYDPASESWTPTGSMSAARSEHTATLLPSGQVLVAGGRDVSSTLSTAELYDPVTGTWTGTGSFQTPRARHTATLLPSGRVLIAGGTGTVLNNGEMYDPATGAWTVFFLPVAPSGHATSLLPSGQVLITGGYNSSSALLYDEVLGHWFADRMTQNRGGHSQTLLPSGQVLVAGGNGGDGPYDYTNGLLTSTAELWDPMTRTWAQVGPMPRQRGGHTATLLLSGNVLVAGGYGFQVDRCGTRLCPWFPNLSETYLYQPWTQSFITISQTATARRFPTATLLPSGKVLVTGGSSGSDDYFNALTTAELYDERG